MKVKFNREYLPMLAAFMAVSDTRYYLNGFHVKPHPDQGVILTATDGHRLVTIHDEEGLADGQYIFPITKKFLAAAKKTKHDENKSVLDSIQIIGNKAYVLSWGQVDGLDFFEDKDEESMALVSHVEYISEIQGRFPDTERLFKGLKLSPVESVGVNVGYVGSLTAICDGKYNSAELMFSGETGSIFIVCGNNREIVALIMPSHCKKEDKSIPDFVKYSGGEAKNEHEAEEGTAE